MQWTGRGDEVRGDRAGHTRPSAESETVVALDRGALWAS